MDGDIHVIGGDYVITAIGQRALNRPPWPYVKCRECEHDLEEHDGEHRCHAPGCDCGKNKA